MRSARGRSSAGPGGVRAPPAGRWATLGTTMPGGTLNIMRHAAAARPHQRRRLQVERRVLIDVERRAVGEQHLDGSVLRAAPIALDKMAHSRSGIANASRARAGIAVNESNAGGRKEVLEAMATGVAARNRAARPTQGYTPDF